MAIESSTKDNHVSDGRGVGPQGKEFFDTRAVYAASETQDAQSAAAGARPDLAVTPVGDMVNLPAGTSIEHIEVDGANLILIQPDGSRVIIAHGALDIPTFVIDDVQIPREALIAALQANNINVAAGPDGQTSAVPANESSGGNFHEAIPGIGDAGPPIDLLPPTALRFPVLEEPQLLGALEGRAAPSIEALTFDPPTGGTAAFTTGDTLIGTDPFPGTLGGSIGKDGAGGPGFTFEGLDGDHIKLGPETLLLRWDPDSHILTASVDGGDRNGVKIFTLIVTDPATGAFTFSQTNNVEHPAGPDGATPVLLELDY